MKKKVFLFGVMLFLLMGKANSTISVSPYYVLFDDNVRIQTMYIANKTDEVQRYRVNFENKYQKENGTYAIYESGQKPIGIEGFADDLIRRELREIELEPKQAMPFRLMKRLKPDTKKGEYVSHIVFEKLLDQEKAKKVEVGDGKIGIDIQARYKLSVPVVIRVGELQAHAEIVNPKIIEEGENIYVAFDILRKGNKSLRGNLKVMADGKEIGVLNSVNVFLSTDKRKIRIPLLTNSELDKTDLKGENITITYTEPKEMGGKELASVRFGYEQGIRGGFRLE
jgi:hypothetical protein